MVFAIDSNVHLGNKNRSFAVNIGDKAFDLLPARPRRENCRADTIARVCR